MNHQDFHSGQGAFAPLLRRLCALVLLLGSGYAAIQAQILDTATDSLVIDTTLKMRKVDELTLLLDPDALSIGRRYRERLQFRLEDILYPDLLMRLDGWANTLGQIGKPYRRYRFGVETSWLQNKLFINPYNGAENVYMIDAEHGVPYFDTRTPFINAYYGQGKADLAQLRVDIAQNITPYLNVAVMYYRRNSSGVYSGHATDQNNLGFSSNFRSRDDRYHAFGNWIFQEHNEEINGGVSQTFDFENLFGKGSQPVALSDALLLRVQRSYFFKHFYRLNADTVNTPHSFRIFNSVQYQQFENEFTDSLINEAIQGWQFPVFPTLSSTAFTADSSFIYEKFASWRTLYKEGLHYQLRLPGFVMNHEIGATNEIMRFEKNVRTFRQTKFARWWNGNAQVTAPLFALRGDWRLNRSTNNFFPAETIIEGGVQLSFPKAKIDYERKIPNDISPKDSVMVVKSHRPFSVFINYLSNDRNPTLQQAFGEGFSNIKFVADRGLRNQRMEQVRAGIAWRSKDTWTKFGVTKGMQLRLTAFQSQTHGMIWYDSTLAVQQMGDTSSQTWRGVEGQLRLRLGKFFFESATTFQASSATRESVNSQLGFIQPSFYTRNRLFYENKDLSIAAIIRGGFEYFYHTNYNSPLFDPVSQMFYPQIDYVQKGYHRFDAFAGTQVRRAYIYLRFENFLEGVLSAGNFTTTLYPMRDRVFMLGVNWTFLD